MMREKKKHYRVYAAVAFAMALLLLPGAGCSGRADKADVGLNASQETSGSGVERPGTSETEVQKPVTEKPEVIAPFPTAEAKPEDEILPAATPSEYQWEKTAVIATDMHYFASELTDYGNAFRYMIEHGDGKMVMYIDQIMDAWIAEVLEIKPDVVILSGDLTLEGEKISHEKLAEKLYDIKMAGIPVLVIPGNHDINNLQAANYRGDDRYPAVPATPEEFREIYRDFGYDDALSEDTASLSYMYQIDEYNRIMMLDSCMYNPHAQVGGAIANETYDWVEEQLEDAWDAGCNVIPVAHHNLLAQSEIYVDDCTIEHSSQLLDILEGWGVPLFLSGHLHVQHFDWSLGDELCEIVTSSLATPQCQYGVLTFRDDGSFAYETRQVDVQTWAREQERKEKDLIDFDEFKEPFLKRVFYNQAYDALTDLDVVLEKEEMASLYAELNYYYYQGTAYEQKDRLTKEPAYQLWEDYFNLTSLTEYLQYIVMDASRDYNRVSGE